MGKNVFWPYLKSLNTFLLFFEDLLKFRQKNALSSDYHDIKLEPIQTKYKKYAQSPMFDDLNFCRSFVSEQRLKFSALS
jgi:hypothetical protein